MLEYGKAENRTAQYPVSPPSAARPRSAPKGSAAVALAGILAVTLPLIGFLSLLLREQLDPQLHNHQAHFLIFGAVGGVAFALGYAAGEAANRRGDARVLLLSLAFMATGGFMGLHAFGTAGVLFSESRAGFQIAIPVGLLVAAFFAAGSAFVDLRPELGPRLIRRRGQLRAAVLVAMAVWFLWTLANLPPLHEPNSEAATGRVLAALAILGTVIYAVSAVRYWRLFRYAPHAALDRRDRVFPAALRGADRRRRHGRAQVARELVGVARPDRARLPDHRVRRPPRVARGAIPGALPADDARAPLRRSAFSSATSSASRASPSGPRRPRSRRCSMRTGARRRRCSRAGTAARSRSSSATGSSPRSTAAATSPTMPLRASQAALALQRAVTALADEHPGWPRLRVGVNSGEAVVRELGGAGHVAYTLVGDTVNTGSRLEGLAPPGGVLIGAATHAELPHGAVVEARNGLRMKGKDDLVDAYVLLALP